MKIDDNIQDEKVQYNINKEAAKISALSSCKTDKHEYLTGKKILLSDQSRIIGQAKFTYSPLWKPFEKQIKQLKSKEKKQVEVLEILKPKGSWRDLKSIEGIFLKETRPSEIKMELNEIIGWEEKK